MSKDYNLSKNTTFDNLIKGFSVPTISVPTLNEDKNPQELTQTSPNIATKPTEQTVSIKDNQTIKNPPTPDDSFVKNPEQNQNKENQQTDKTSYGKIVLYSMLSVGAAALFLTRGISGNTANKIKLWADKIENNLLQYASKNRAVGYIDEKIVVLSKKTKDILSLSNAIANFTAIKDSFTKKLTSWKPLNKIKCLSVQRFCDFCTKNILKITEGAVDSKYKNAGETLEHVEMLMKKALKGAKLSPEQSKKIKGLIDSIYPTYREGFSKNTRSIRLQRIHEDLKDLDKEVFNALLSPFKKESKKGSFKNVYSSYITQTKQNSAQKAHKRLIDKAKMAISNDLDDVSERMQSVTNDLKYHFNPKDKECRLLFGDLLEKIEKFKNFSRSDNKNMRDGIQKDILSTLDTIKQKYMAFSINNSKNEIVKYTDEEVAKLSKLISEMKDVITNSSEKGLLQNILSELKPGMDEKAYRALKAKVGSFNNSLNKAINLEGGNMFDKIAEAKVGSIPTDMLGIATTIGGGAWAVSKGKDKNEKIGATLKIGVPLLGTIATYFYSTARAFSGATNLAFGLATMYILNKIGSSVFDYYQKRVVENKTVTEIAQDVYDDTTKI